MSPDAVLTDDQKVIRFRKTILKRRQASESNHPDDDDDDDDHDQEEQGPGGDSRSADDEDEDDAPMGPAASVPATSSSTTTFSDVASQPSVNLIESLLTKTPKIPKLENVEKIFLDDDAESNNNLSAISAVKEEDISMDFSDVTLSNYAPESIDNDDIDAIFDDIASATLAESPMDQFNRQSQIDPVLNAYMMAARQLKSPRYTGHSLTSYSTKLLLGILPSPFSNLRSKFDLHFNLDQSASTSC